MTRAVFIGIALALFFGPVDTSALSPEDRRGYAPCPAQIMCVPTSRKIQRCIAKFLRFKKVPNGAAPTGSSDRWMTRF